MVDLQSGVCRKDELPEVLAGLNGEFIHSRGRSTELQLRYPDALSDPGNIVVTRLDTRIVSALVIKRFTWRVPPLDLRAAMIGMVWTHPTMRGKGLARTTLTHAQSMMATEKLDFAVLWTSQPHVYSSLGWVSADRGCYAAGPGKPASQPATEAWPEGFDRMLCIRERLSPIHATCDNANRLPLPANELRLVLEPDGYAVVGIAGENAYVLDLVADEGSMPQLWARIETMGKSIHMNVPSGSPPQKWLTRELQWKLPGKPLAMWLPMTDLGRQQRFGEFYIPLLSRI